MPECTIVPARVGGVDLSSGSGFFGKGIFVPARVGGVDLSPSRILARMTLTVSPPVWAGWI